MREVAVSLPPFGADQFQVICQVCGKNHPQSTENRDESQLIPVPTQPTEPKPHSAFSYNITNNNNNSDKSSQKKQEKPSSFQRMLDEIRAIFDAPDNTVDIEAVKQVLARYQSNRDDWAKYAFYEPFKYKRNLVDEHEKYNLMILSWGGGAKSKIHDHSGSHCFMKLLDGKLKEIRFDWPKSDGQEMRVLSENLMGPKETEILYIHDRVGLHQVENVSNTQSGATLHIYIPPYKSCHCFEQQTGKSNECQVVFYSRGGKLSQESS